MSAVTGFRNPTNTPLNSGVVNPDNGWADDAAYATFDNVTDDVRYNTFGNFSIPGGASVLGVEVVLNIKYTGAGINRNVQVRYTVNGGTNFSNAKATDVTSTSDQDLTFGGDGDTWGLSSLNDTHFNNNTNFHVEVSLTSLSVTSIDLDAVSVRIYYDISHTSTFTADAIVKTIVTKTFTADGVIVPPTQRYSKGDYTALPSNDDELTTLFDQDAYDDVATSDNVRSDQLAIGKVAIFQFKEQHSNNTDAIVGHAELQTTIAPSEIPVLLQIFNRTSGLWETLDTDNTSSADTDFELQGTQSVDLTDYYDANNWVAFRIYQDMTPA